MLDRASTFAEPGIVRMLQTQFVPTAIDQAYQRRQQDTEGRFYRKIAGQGPRKDFRETTQGFYVATASGELLLYNNNRDPAKLRRLLRQSLRDHQKRRQATPPGAPIEAENHDPRYSVAPPADGLVLRVRAKVLDGYAPTNNRWKRIFQQAISRDNLWVTAEEHRRLAAGEFPLSLQRRIARYHLVDNTRGEPPMWKSDEVRQLEIRQDSGRIEGSAHLETARGNRGVEAELLGFVDAENGVVTRFDLVALGDFWGRGPFTSGAPDGRFPLAVSFTLADGSDMADRVPPQGSRGWVEGYLR